MSQLVTISVDAMGGDNAPLSVIDGIVRALRKDSALRFILHGDEPRLKKLAMRRKLAPSSFEICHTDDVITMDDKPSIAVRRGRNSSLWRAIESVKTGDAAAVVSAGNTGALMAMGLFCLRRIKGVDRPAIAALWPVKGPRQHCVALDMGADVRAEAEDLVAYAIMGAAYARVVLRTDRPRVAVLNVGVEETKGRPEVREAAEMLRRITESGDGGFEFVGFIEANAITTGQADVVVTDGFTGNVALKSAEGTARFIGDHLRGTFENTWRGRMAGLLAIASLRSLKKRIDPRRVNGGVFLGLDGVVVKSHGAADATGFAAALQLAAGMAREDFIHTIAGEVERALHSTQTPVQRSTDRGEA